MLYFIRPQTWDLWADGDQGFPDSLLEALLVLRKCNFWELWFYFTQHASHPEDAESLQKIPQNVPRWYMGPLSGELGNGLGGKVKRRDLSGSKYTQLSEKHTWSFSPQGVQLKEMS